MKSVHKYLFLFLIHVLLLASCNTTDNFRKKNGEAAIREFNQLNYMYGFLKDKFEESHAEPSAYKLTISVPDGTVKAKLYPGDTLIRFVYRSKSEKWKSDSHIAGGSSEATQDGKNGNGYLPRQKEQSLVGSA